MDYKQELIFKYFCIVTPMKTRRHNLEIALEVYQSLYPNKEKSINALGKRNKIRLENSDSYFELI